MHASAESPSSTVVRQGPMSNTPNEDASAGVPVLMRLPDLHRPRPKTQPLPVTALAADDEEPMVHWWDQWRQAAWNGCAAVGRNTAQSLSWLVRQPGSLARDHGGWLAIGGLLLVGGVMAWPMFRPAPPIDEEPVPVVQQPDEPAPGETTQVEVVPDLAANDTGPPPTVGMGPDEPSADSGEAVATAPPRAPRETFLAVEPVRPASPGVAQLKGIVLDPEPSIAERPHEPNRPSLR